MTTWLRGIVVLGSSLVITSAVEGAQRTGSGMHNVVDAIAAVRSLEVLTDKLELNATERKLKNVRFWADKVGDLANDLDDELDDLAVGDSAHSVHKIYRELHGAYLNLRAVVHHVPDPQFRREALRGTLEQFDNLRHAIYGIRLSPPVDPFGDLETTPKRKGKVDEAEETEEDGLPHPRYSVELDGDGDAKSAPTTKPGLSTPK
jgi:hypothetical protein